MRMISQALREESIDYSQPQDSTRPWLRRKIDSVPLDALEVAEEVEREGMLHVAPE